MIILTGDHRNVRANVSGPVGDYMPPEIVFVFQITAEGANYWKPGTEGNTLTELVAGQEYYAVSSADIEVGAFSDITETNLATEKTLLFRAESVDNNWGLLPAINLPNSCANYIRISAALFTGTQVAAATADATANVGSGGSVTVNDITGGYLVGFADLALDVATNQIIPKVKNTYPAYVGVTKWAVKIEIVQVIYEPPPP